jgi:predicted  nucleic acid-binding Zn-ribbon protein
VRTSEEVEDLNNNIGKMKEEISNKFEKVEQFKDQLSKKKTTLTKEQEELTQIKDKLSQTLSTSDYEINVAEKKYQVHDQFAPYSAA